MEEGDRTRCVHESREDVRWVDEGSGACDCTRKTRVLERAGRNWIKKMGIYDFSLKGRDIRFMSLNEGKERMCRDERYVHKQWKDKCVILL